MSDQGPTVHTVNSSGVDLHVESSGNGPVMLFLHEFAGDHRSWEPQVRYFSRSFTCVTYAARGYRPSAVPVDPDAYSQQHAVDDAVSVLNELGIRCAHVVGLSMGGFAALHLAIQHPEHVSSIVVAACGWGSEPGHTEAFRAECNRIADAFETEGSAGVANWYAEGSTRVQFQNKNPRDWYEFRRQLAEHDPVGSALTMRGVQAGRPSLYHLESDLSTIQTPTLLVTGDEDEGCLNPALYLKRTISTSGLVILPRTGHTCNLEDPAAFNAAVDMFVRAVGQGSWGTRDPRSLSASWTGVGEASRS